MTPLKSLLDPDQLRHHLATASSTQLTQARALLLELIEEQRASDEQAVLERKGQRVLSDMRGLMAKAGISMDELQSVLPK